MKKITSLTPQQEVSLALYRDKWLEIGLDTSPMDKGAARLAVELAYRCAGLEPPKIFVFLESPYQGTIGSVLLKNLPDQVGAQLRPQVRDQVRDQVWDQVGAQVGDQVRDQVWDQVWAQVRDQVGAQVRAQVGAQVRDQVWAQVRDQVGDQVWAQVRAQVGDQVWAQVWAQVGDQVGDQVWAQVRDQVGDQVRDQVGDQVWAQVRAQVGDQVWAQVRAQVGAQVWAAGYGLHDVNWLGFYNFFQSELQLKCCQKLDGLAAVARSCGWWWPFKNAVIITSKPCSIQRDENLRLHCEDSLALTYPDGWGIYAWHGVRVPQNVILAPETITAEQIKIEQNAEVRRVMMERMGWERFCVEARMKVLQEDALYSYFPAIPVSDMVNPGQRLVTTYREGKETAELLEADGLMDLEDRPLRFVRLTDPSTGRQYTIRVLHTHTRCYEAVAWTFGMTEKQYKNSPYFRQGDVALLPLSNQKFNQQHS